MLINTASQQPNQRGGGGPPESGLLFVPTDYDSVLTADGNKTLRVSET